MKLFNRQTVALARILEIEQSAGNGNDDFSLSAGDPTLGPCRWKVGDGEDASVRIKDVLGAFVIVTSHVCVALGSPADEGDIAVGPAAAYSGALSTSINSACPSSSRAQP